LVRTIFVDGTMIKIRGRRTWVWVAFEPGLRVFLAFHVSYNQSIFDAHAFKALRQRYGREEADMDGRGVWYPEAC
jgi:transposase-like protein